MPDNKQIRLVPVRLVPGTAQEARVFLSQKTDTEKRIGRVAELINGFETPFGMELLATVH
ncbi:MAG: hypothetical protein FWG14_10015 [Peptococcaceae bacterium]|nr:hypothetical protein [Peptococcaceae bacterium]